MEKSNVYIYRKNLMHSNAGLERERESPMRKWKGKRRRSWLLEREREEGEEDTASFPCNLILDFYLFIYFLDN